MPNSPSADLSGEQTNSLLLADHLSRQPRVTVVHKQFLNRECISQILRASCEGRWIVDPYATIEEAIASERIAPTVVLTHVHSSNEQALEVLFEVAKTSGELKILIFTDEPTEALADLARRAIRSGVRGIFSTKDSGVRILRSATEFVINGGTYIPRELLLSPTSSPTIEATAQKKGALTVRQTEVLARLKQGRPNKLIAYDLGMSESTVKVHVRNIMNRLGATNRTQAAFMTISQSLS